MTKNESTLPVSSLSDLFVLDDSSGALKWKRRLADSFVSSDARSADHKANNWNSKYAGSLALNCHSPTGHLCGRINDKMFYSHRVVFAMIHGYWPVNQIDHINGNPSDNRPSNLRDVTQLENLRNQARSKQSTSGVTGVSWNKRLGKWASHITVNDKFKHLGFFKSFEDACTSRKEASLLFGFHINHGRST